MASATFTINGAIEAYPGVGRSKLYELIGAGKIKAVKCGKRTLIVGDSIRQYMENLPPAKIGASRKAA